MFAFLADRKLTIVHRAARLLSIVVIVLNALGPTTAIALSPAGSDQVPSGAKGSAVRYTTLALRSATLFQDDTVTASPTEIAPPLETATETPTPEPLDTASPVTTTPSVTPTPPAESTPTAEPTFTSPATLATLEVAPTPSALQTVTPSLAMPNEPVVLSFKLSVFPEQAAPGDEVTHDRHCQ
jgi:hypothetical protein